MKRQSLALVIMLSLPVMAAAEAPEIISVQTHNTGMGWDIEVTLKHPDTGWDHYADGWEILDESGTVIGTRVLHHPHVDEQPFTRSLGSVMLPDGARKVFVRAKCSLDGTMDTLYEVVLQK